MTRIQINSHSHVIQITLICFLVIIFVIIASLYLPPGVDWQKTYRPATIALLSGKSPYSIDIFFNAPWLLILFIPFALLPEQIGRAILLLLGIGSFGYTAYKLGAKPPALIVFLLSPPVLHCLLNSNIDWIPLLGFILPPQIGLLFLAIKPQIGIGVALFWFIEAWRKGGFHEIVRVFWPVSLAFGISFALFGLWPFRFNEILAITQTYNASLWPSSIPVGLTLLIAAIHKRKIKYAMASAPCLSPYVLLHAWVGVLVTLVSEPIETYAAVAGLWILVIIRAFTGAL